MACGLKTTGKDGGLVSIAERDRELRPSGEELANRSDQRGRKRREWTDQRGRNGMIAPTNRGGISDQPGRKYWGTPTNRGGISDQPGRKFDVTPYVRCAIFTQYS